ncbi:hypothetical protein Bca52824_022049 [Brassica carinata]|uniref:Uncharacterized protein n=1 Tax=Brassica carinata TaxID=52824 RepID=A0A8X8ASK9_BRACI|nr:hypothetical protein Bca52824_022049 [Brassica carinata]
MSDTFQQYVSLVSSVSGTWKDRNQKPIFMFGLFAGIYGSKQGELSRGTGKWIYENHGKKTIEKSHVVVLVTLLLNIALIAFISVYYNAYATVQLPWWRLLLAYATAVFVTPLIDVIIATPYRAGTYKRLQIETYTIGGFMNYPSKSCNL